MSSTSSATPSAGWTSSSASDCPTRWSKLSTYSPSMLALSSPSTTVHCSCVALRQYHECALLLLSPLYGVWLIQLSLATDIGKLHKRKEFFLTKDTVLLKLYFKKLASVSQTVIHDSTLLTYPQLLQTQMWFPHPIVNSSVLYCHANFFWISSYSNTFNLSHYSDTYKKMYEFVCILLVLCIMFLIVCFEGNSES